MPKPLVIAHRGDSSRALENSLEAVRLALAVPVDMIEIDIRKSRDNRLFAMHDKDTGRTADRNIDIERSTAAEIAQVKLKNGEPVPALDDVLRTVAGKAGINIEIKSDGAGAVFSRHFFLYRYSGYVLVSSFKEPEARAARGVMLDLPVSLVFDEFMPEDVPAYKAKGYDLISLGKRTVTRKLIDACHEQGIKVFVRTVDDEAEMKKFIEWGVDGMYSSRPDDLKKIVGRF